MFRPNLLTKNLIGATAVLLLAMAVPASAQTTTPRDWIDRGYFNFNVGFETTSGTLTDSSTFTLYGESGSQNVSQNVDSGSLIDFSAGARVWRNVSVGIGFHRGSNSSEANGAATVPHPVLFNSNRAATVAAADLDRSEQAFHIQVGYMLLINEEISVHVTGGPSFFRLNQDVVSGLSFSERSFPFDTVNATGVISERSDSAVGVNAGVDVAYKFYQSDAYQVGAGVFLRYAGASARITIIENEVDTDVGGMQIGFGARVRF